MTTSFLLPQKPFYLVRHGETEANAARIAAGGYLDTPLTQNGILQAKTLADKIKALDIKPSAIYHSSLSRARDTATHINKHLGLSMTEVPDLIEHIFGDWENKDWDGIKPLVEAGVEPPNGETYMGFTLRVQKELTKILNQNHEQPPLIVAHGGTFHSFHRLYQEDHVTVSNCEMHYFTPHPAQTSFPWIVKVIHKNA